MAEPTRTLVAPNPMAVSKSPDMPIDSFARPFFEGELGKQREVGTGIFIDRRNAHQPVHLQAQLVAA